MRSYSQQTDFMIKGELISCNDSKDEPHGYVYLFKDSVAIDSINTYHELPDILGGFFWRSGKFKFVGLCTGKYQIRYDTYFDSNDYPIFEINGADIKDIVICFDKLSERYCNSETSLNRMELNDTLFINVYVALGEFGGYDEGFWITKTKSGYIGRLYKLPNTYGVHRDKSTVIKIYEENQQDIEPISENFPLTKENLDLIGQFLLEIKYYRDNWISNAPEHFLIQDKNELVFKVKNNSHYKPYIKLKNKIINGL